jgi:hypothetical protein
LVPAHAQWIFFEIKSERQRIITLLDHRDEASGA